MNEETGYVTQTIFISVSVLSLGMINNALAHDRFNIGVQIGGYGFAPPPVVQYYPSQATVYYGAPSVYYGGSTVYYGPPVVHYGGVVGTPFINRGFYGGHHSGHYGNRNRWGNHYGHGNNGWRGRGGRRD